MKTTEEKNRMIAEFMGYVRSGFNGELVFNTETREEFEVEQLKYHTSWDWLMPVVERIEEYEMNVKIHTSYTSIHFKRKQCIVDVDGGSKIENTCNAVVKFIELYNKQK